MLFFTVQEIRPMDPTKKRAYWIISHIHTNDVFKTTKISKITFYKYYSVCNNISNLIFLNCLNLLESAYFCEHVTFYITYNIYLNSKILRGKFE